METTEQSFEKARASLVNIETGKSRTHSTVDQDGLEAQAQAQFPTPDSRVLPSHRLVPSDTHPVKDGNF